MNARLIKETRALLPVFACTLPLIVVPSLIWPSEGFGYSPCCSPNPSRGRSSGARR